MHGLDAKLDCLVFGERAALLYAKQGFAAEGHLGDRLKQFAVAHPRSTLVEPVQQLAVEIITGGSAHFVARTIEDMQARGETIDSFSANAAG